MGLDQKACLCAPPALSHTLSTFSTLAPSHTLHTPPQFSPSCGVSIVGHSMCGIGMAGKKVASVYCFELLRVSILDFKILSNFASVQVFLSVSHQRKSNQPRMNFASPRVCSRSLECHRTAPFPHLHLAVRWPAAGANPGRAHRPAAAHPKRLAARPAPGSFTAFQGRCKDPHFCASKITEITKSQGKPPK